MGTVVNSCDEVLRLAAVVRYGQQPDPADARSTLDDFVASAAESVPGAQYAGITITQRRTLATVAATGRYPVVLDEIQNHEGEGPCLAAARDDHTIRIDDLAADTRWPRYRREALQYTPIRSVLSIQLFSHHQKAGALSFYAERALAFDDDSMKAGATSANHAALAWEIVQRERQFRTALASRDIIGQAKGILMERFSIDAVAAFDLLKRLSQESNTAVTVLAERLVGSDHPLRRRPAR